MRIVIVDLHCNGFLLRNFDHIVNKRKPVIKHAFLLKEALKEGYEVLDYITGTSSGLWIGKGSLFLNKLEAGFVFWKNGFRKKIRCITDKHEIRQDDIVLFYSHTDDKFDLSDTPGRKFCNVNHFFSMCSCGKNWLPDFLKPDRFEGYICEADVRSDSLFFRKYLPVANKKMVLLPYVAEKRFQKTVPFAQRENKALALGSCSITVDLLADVYGTDQLHPMRNEILERKLENPEQIECMIERIVHPADLFATKEEDGKILKFSKRFCNHFYRSINSPFRQNGKNAGYYNKDMVTLLNGFKMFIFPEEVTGIPALGFAEGMNCGCAYIGVSGPMYEKIGMQPGIHYIGYDGNYDDLVEKIRYYQTHEDELEKIAENGYRFVKKNLTQKKVFRSFIEQIVYGRSYVHEK